MSAPLWTAADIAAATGGAVHGAFAATGVAFDSREVGPGDLFVALKGAATDGHRFARQALAGGAAGVLASEPLDGPHVRVADTQAGLEALGRAARDRAVNATRFAVTGSVGKTSVRAALEACLGAQGAGAAHASVKSYNNATGVPLSLARMPADARFGVFEIGMNHRGEIAPLAAQVRPHVAAVTWVGTAHIENLGSEEAIADEKGDIFSGLAPGGAAVIPFDNAHRNRLIGAALMHGERIITFGLGEGARVRATDLVEDGAGSRFTADVAGRRVAVHLPRPGRHLVSNALCVLACVHAAGADPAIAAATLGRLDAEPGRGRIVALPGGATLLDEAYNANPDSVAAALATLAALAADGRKLAVIGAMRELGAHAQAAHAQLAPRIRAAGVARLALVGEETRPLKDAMPEAELLPDAAAALAWARSELRPGDLLLVKGSNSVGLMGLVAALERGDAA
jgi:UDP-N-acetylmuramoyl-tripeptide--D-alanyl-D-alanine ligase